MGRRDLSGVVPRGSHGRRAPGRVGGPITAAWDSEDDAAEFAAAMGRWIAGGARPGFSVATGSTVTTAFATDERALALLRGATS